MGLSNGNVHPAGLGARVLGAEELGSAVTECSRC